MTWLPTAHSDTGPASIARQPLALVCLTELVPMCTEQTHPYFRMIPLINWHNQCNLFFGSRVGRRPYSLNLWKTVCRLACEKLTLALHYQDVQVREETIPQTVCNCFPKLDNTNKYVTITHHFVGRSTASASSGGCLYQADSCDVYSIVISTNDMAEMKICSREWASSAALNHRCTKGHSCLLPVKRNTRTTVKTSPMSWRHLLITKPDSSIWKVPRWGRDFPFISLYRQSSHLLTQHCCYCDICPHIYFRKPLLQHPNLYQ